RDLGHLSRLVAWRKEASPASHDVLIRPAPGHVRIQPHQQVQMIVQDRKPRDRHREDFRKFLDTMFDPAFGRVYAPSAVIKELLHPRSPQAVGTWASSPPEWLTVQDPTHTGAWKLGRGETAAISLALELKADRALIDDRDGSRQATRSGLKVVGTLGILEEAAKRGLIDIEQKTKELKETNFRASEKLYQTVLERVREQKLAREATEQKEEPSTPTSEGD